MTHSQKQDSKQSYQIQELTKQKEANKLIAMAMLLKLRPPQVAFTTLESKPNV